MQKIHMFEIWMSFMKKNEIQKIVNNFETMQFLNNQKVLILFFFECSYVKIAVGHGHEHSMAKQ